MSPLLAIFIITAFVCTLLLVWVLCRAAAIGEEAEREIIKRIAEDKAREQRAADEFDSTRFYDEKYGGPR